MVLDKLMKDHGGFEHNRQSLRVVEELEQKYPGFPGLNLSWEVREGLAKHETSYDLPGSRREFETKSASLERSEEHTSELQSQSNLVCRLLLEKKKKKVKRCTHDKSH